MTMWTDTKLKKKLVLFKTLKLVSLTIFQSSWRLILCFGVIFVCHEAVVLAFPLGVGEEEDRKAIPFVYLPLKRDKVCLSQTF